MATAGPWRGVLLGCTALLISGPALATDVCGPITSDTTWTLADSPYVVTCNVVVFGGATLTIEPGVEVRFQPGTRLVAQDATIEALGTAGLRITFVSDDPQDAGIGVRLRADFGAVGHFENCDFSGLEQAIHTTDCCGGELSVSGCQFLDNDTAVDAYVVDRPTISDTHFENNTYALRGPGDAEISDSLFERNAYAVYDSSYSLTTMSASRPNGAGERPF